MEKIYKTYSRVFWEYTFTIDTDDKIIVWNGWSWRNGN